MPTSHVDVVLLYFRTLFVKELVNGIFLRHRLKRDAHHRKARLTQVGRATLATGLAVGALIAGIICDWIDARKANQRF